MPNFGKWILLMEAMTLKKKEPTILKLDYSLAFVFIGLLMIAFVLLTDINITAWKLSSYK